jgi:hypothetical protein
MPNDAPGHATYLAAVKGMRVDAIESSAANAPRTGGRRSSTSAIHARGPWHLQMVRSTSNKMQSTASKNAGTCRGMLLASRALGDAPHEPDRRCRGQPERRCRGDEQDSHSRSFVAQRCAQQPGESVDESLLQHGLIRPEARALRFLRGIAAGKHLWRPIIWIRSLTDSVGHNRVLVSTCAGVCG